MMIDFNKIEKKWQSKWERSKIFQVKESKGKNKFYVLEMFPYPSGSGLHMGHAFNYTIGDIYARFKRMMGYNVLYPMGYDSFGLPAENAAIEAKENPKKFTENSIKNFIKQQKELGLSYDWSRIIMTHTQEYYKWNQYFFLKFLENGLVYRGKASVNWCPKCNTVLANEQVHNNKCWRHTNVDVEIKQLEQWFIKTTKYAEELLKDIKKLEWPERIKIMQENWIGKSHGTDIIFKINNESWNVFTTRTDTLFGVTFIVISAQHPRLYEIVTKEQKKQVDNFLKKIKTTKQEDIEQLDKEGVFTGSYTIHPLTNEKIPVYVGNFVIAEYGSGMVMAVPAHDQRDFEFAEKYKLPIKNVIEPVYTQTTEPGKVVENLSFDHRDTVIAIVKHWSEDKYIGLKWKKVAWGTFITGGIEKGQTHEEAAKKEIKEETGYINLKLVKDFGRVHGKFYHVPKKVNRFAHAYVLYFELQNDDQKKISKDEQETHEIKWLNVEELRRFLTPDTHKYTLKILTGKQEAYIDDGILTNSGKFNGLSSEEARIKITKELEKNNLGKKAINYKLRDWLISRQRYWGTPIPVIYCNDCGIVPVLEKDLPIKLPDKVKFGKGNPLTTNKKFLEVKCPKCKKKAKRETDTMDTFFDSSWYFLRYCDNKNNKKAFDAEKIKYWMPVDQYIGGAEHACMHLIYARFFTKALRDLEFLKFNEPFTKLYNQGMLHGEDGFVMSKSRGNVVMPETVSKKYGIDTARLFLISGASPDKDMEWSSKGVEGSLRFIRRVFDYSPRIKIGKTSKKVESKLNKTIKEVTNDIEEFRYNFAIIKIRDLFESLEQEISKKDIEKFLKLLHPFCPHITEELWEKIGNKNFLSLEKWPDYDESRIDKKFEEAEKAVDNLVFDIHNVVNVIKEKQGKEYEKVYVYVLPKELEYYDVNELSKRTGKEVKIYSVNDKNKYDPMSKSKKAELGKPAIYLE